jgi:hypothetical protein
VPRVVEVPDAVRVTATAAGAPGRRWLASLGDLLAELEEVGDVTVGDTMSGGTECLVAEATRVDRTPAVVKVATPSRAGQARARFLAHHTGLDEQRIWEWGYLERLATGLLSLKEGHTEWAHAHLAVAEAWALA